MLLFKIGLTGVVLAILFGFLADLVEGKARDKIESFFCCLAGLMVLIALITFAAAAIQIIWRM